MLNQISNLSQISYVRKYTITSSKEDGVKVVELVNKDLRVLLNESKALDIMQIYHKGMNLSFISKNGFTTKNDDFLKRFEGGMLYTVGLDSAGVREGYPLHGTFHNLKPTITRMEANEEMVIVEAFIEDTALFGKNLVMKRKYILANNALKLEDTLINNGKEVEDYCILYHNNIGYPLLDEEDQIDINANSVIPRTNYAKKMKNEWNIITSPIDVIDETCYFIDIKDGKASLINKKQKRKLTISWNMDNLKEFVLWKSMRSNDYALGFEPSTTKLDENFNYCKIKPNESINFSLRYRIEEI